MSNYGSLSTSFPSSSSSSTSCSSSASVRPKKSKWEAAVNNPLMSLRSSLRSSQKKLVEPPNIWTETHCDPFHSLSQVQPRSNAAKKSYRTLHSLLVDTWYIVATPVLLILVGVLTSFLSMSVNLFTQYSYSLRHNIVFLEPATATVDTPNATAHGSILSHGALSHESMWADIDGGLLHALSRHSMLLYVAFSTISSLVTVYLTQSISPYSSGSGIPEVRGLLTSSYLHVITTPSIVVAKLVGLCGAFTAGLSVGKEGVFVSIAVALCSILLRTPPFAHISSNDLLRLSCLSASAAGGVGATFFTPFAAVIFAVEVTSDYTLVNNLPRCFLCAIAAILPVGILGEDKVFGLFSDLPKMAQGYTVGDLAHCLALGLFMGGLGCVFVVCIEKVVLRRNEFISNTPRLRYVYTAVVTLLTSVFVYHDLRNGIASRGDQRSVTNYMFQTSSVNASKPSSLMFYLPLKFIVTVVSTTLPLPVGLFTPVFLIGGTAGRYYGEVVQALTIHHHHTASTMAASVLKGFHPWEYALIGAAAFSAGVTRAISTAVIILELSGEHHLRTPTGVAVLVAYYVGNRFTKSVYDVLMDTNSVPTLADLPDDLKVATAGEICENWRGVVTSNDNDNDNDNNNDNTTSNSRPIITLQTTVREAISIIEQHTSTGTLTDSMVLPLVDTNDTMVLAGDFVVKDLRNSVSSVVAAASMTTEALASPLLDQTIVFVTNEGGVLKPFGGVRQNKLVPKSWTVLVDPAPYVMQAATQAAKIHLVFRMLKLNQAYITSGGRLVGIVDRQILRRFVGGREKKRIDKVGMLVKGCGTFLRRKLCEGCDTFESDDDVTDEEEEEGGRHQTNLGEFLSI